MKRRLYVGHPLVAANGARLTEAQEDQIRGEAAGFAAALARTPCPQAEFENKSLDWGAGWNVGWERGLALVVGR